jgi:hypothetical protein
VPAQGPKLERHWIFQPPFVAARARVARRDPERAEPDHLRQPMDNPVRRTRIFHTARQPFGDPRPTLHLGQQQDPAIRRQLSAIKTVAFRKQQVRPKQSNPT